MSPSGHGQLCRCTSGVNLAGEGPVVRSRLANRATEGAAPRLPSAEDGMAGSV